MSMLTGRTLRAALVAAVLLPAQLLSQQASTPVPSQPPSASEERKLTPAEEKAADMRMPKLDRSALHPEKRQPLTVKEDERNPFGMVALPSGAPIPIDLIKSETEEQKIRRVLASMRITGASGLPGSRRVLIGSLAAREGEDLPKMFANQAERLTVRSITDREVILVFADGDKSLAQRTIQLPIDLKPKVGSLLVGEVFLGLVPFGAGNTPMLPPLMEDSVKQTLDSLKNERLEALIERPSEMLNAPASLPTDATTAPPAP